MGSSQHERIKIVKLGKDKNFSKHRETWSKVKSSGSYRESREKTCIMYVDLDSFEKAKDGCIVQTVTFGMFPSLTALLVSLHCPFDILKLMFRSSVGSCARSIKTF